MSRESQFAAYCLDLTILTGDETLIISPVKNLRLHSLLSLVPIQCILRSHPNFFFLQGYGQVGITIISLLQLYDNIVGAWRQGFMAVN